MPIDASLYAQIQKPLKMPDVGEILRNAAQLRAAQQDYQVNDERLKQARLQNEETERQMADAKTIRGRLAQFGGNWDKALPTLAGEVHPDTFAKLQRGVIETKKQLGELDEQRRRQIEFNLGHIAASGQLLLNTATDQRPAVWANERNRLINVLGIPGEQIPEEYPGDDAVQGEMLHSMGVKGYLEQQRAADEARQRSVASQDTHEESLARQPKLEAEAEGAVRQNDAAMLATAAEQGPQALAAALSRLPQARRAPFVGLTANTTPAEIRRIGLTPEQVTTADQNRRNADQNITEAELAWISQHDPDAARRQQADAALKRLDASKLASRSVINDQIPGMQIGGGGVNQTTGEEFLKSIPPSIAAQVKAIAEGRSAIPSASTRSQAAAQIRDAVFRYDPSFSEQRAQVRRAFTAGNDGRNIGALNTAIVHLGRLGDTAQALENGLFTPKNELFNWFKDKFGSDAVTNFSLLKDAVAGEMAAALKGTATDIEIEKMGKSIRAANSPAQMRGVIQEGMGILNDKANTYDERYHREMPDDQQWSPILPSARAQLQRHGIGRNATPQGAGGRGQSTTGRRPTLTEIFK